MKTPENLFKLCKKYNTGIIRLLAVSIIPLFLIVATAYPVFACIITISPADASGNSGDLLTFTINIQNTHRNCSEPVEETQIKLKGVELVSQTAWKKISALQHEKQITVKLLEPGEGTIEVIRICPKGGGDELIKISINEPPAGMDTSSDIAAVSVIQDADTETAVPPSANTESIISDGEVKDPTWFESFIDAISQPQIVALVILIIAAIVALSFKMRRFRFVVLLASIAYLGFVIGGCPCVLGSLQNMILRLGQIKYYLVVYLQVGIPVVATVLFGRVFCGWVCPMGAVQNFVYRKEIGKKKIHFEDGTRIHNILRYAKYLFLVIMIIAVIITGTMVLENIDPFKALFNLDFSLLVPTILLIVLLLVSLFVGFPWCKYACPLGAFLGLFSRFTLFKVKINDSCTNCRACHTAICDYSAINPGELKPSVNQMECMRCGECISRCPSHAIKLTAK